METMVRPQDQGVEARPQYVKPSMRIMNETEILSAFQMTAAKISAAGCWWGSCPCVSS
jgi:hypothetical protein